MKQSNIPVPPVCIGCRDCTVPAAVPGTRSPAASFSVTGYRHGPRLQDAVVEEPTLAVVGNPSPPSQARPGCTRLGLATAGVRPFGPATAVGEGDPVEHGLSLAVQRNFIALEQPFTVLTAGIEGHGGAFDKGVPIPCLVAGPAQLGPDAHGTPRTPWQAAHRVLLHSQSARGCRGSAGLVRAATGVWRTACTAPWSCRSRRITVACVGPP